MKSYEYIDHTADIGIRAYGMSLGELLQHAGEGLSNLIIDKGTITESLEKHITIDRCSLEELLVTWLGELNYLFETKGLIFKRFIVDIKANNSLYARCFGEKYNPARHAIKMLIKAVTYHQLRVEKKGDVWESCTFFDI
ncbi:MAG: archease [bacterium]